LPVFPQQKLPAFAYYKPRNRYKAGSLLKYLSLNTPKGYDLVLASRIRISA
jgi:hypothetical protein